MMPESKWLLQPFPTPYPLIDENIVCAAGRGIVDTDDFIVTLYT